MICPKCKKEVADKLSICPRCGTVLDKVKQNNTLNKKNDSITPNTKKDRVIKSKVVTTDETDLVGGVVSKQSFIKLSKRDAKKKETMRKDYVNYIDYKEAKEKEEEKRSKISKSSKSLVNSVAAKDLEKVNASKRAKETVTLKNEKNVVKKSEKVPVVSSSNATSVFGKKTKMSQEQIYSTKDIYKENTLNNLDNAKESNQINENNKFFVNPGNAKKVDKHVSFMNITVEKKNSTDKSRKKDRMNFLNFVAYIVVIILWVAAIGTVFKVNVEDYHFSEKDVGNVENKTYVDDNLIGYNGVSKSGQVGGTSSEGRTSIVYDNQYLKVMTFNNESDVKKLIVADSVKQKDNCPSNIIKIENEIVDNYGVTAVNFCEIDEELALELRDVIRTIYNRYPSARNYLTNITIANVGEQYTYIAAFMPSFNFATSNTSTNFPIAIKTQIILNASSFLNESKFENAVERSTKSGYFPPNATKSSTVAHEFGHYLSFVALSNKYKSKQLNFVKYSQYSSLTSIINDFDNGEFSYDLLNEAYQEYKKEYPGTSFDGFRKSISRYAMAKDSNGLYIYDETIAEAFHDVYLNGDSAKPASKYIMKVLESKL